MTLIESLILGLIQGITEFFPISSSAHLILLRPIFGFGEPDLWFDVWLHGGTWLAVTLFLLPRFRQLFERPLLIVWILLATIPAGVFGVLFEGVIEDILRVEYFLIGSILLGLGVVFLFVRQRGDITLANIGLREAVIIGCAQALALIPGVSRSGITLLAALGVGMLRKDAVLFSYFLSVTTIGGAFFKGLLELGGDIPAADILWPGFIVSFVSGFFACVYLLRIVQSKNLRPFGIYRIIFAASVMVFLLIR